MAIGYLYMPGGAGTLAAEGVKYTRAVIPTLGNDPSIVKSDNAQIITGRKQFLSVYGAYETATIVGSTLTMAKEGNYFVLAAVDNAAYVTINRSQSYIYVLIPTHLMYYVYSVLRSLIQAI